MPKLIIIIRAWLIISMILPATYILPAYGNSRSSFRITRTTGQKDGLSGNKIQSIVKDSLGTYWIGTTRGLDRLSENKILHYRQDELYNKEINFIAVDGKKNVWVSSNRNLLLYDFHSDTFSPMTTDRQEPIAPLNYDTVSDGIIFNTYGGFFKYFYETGEFRLLLAPPKPYISYNGFRMADDTSAIVTSADGSVYLLDVNSGNRNLIYDFGRKILVKDICMDNEGRLWIAVYGEGLFCLLPDRITHGVKADSPVRVIFRNEIILSMKYEDGRILAATDGGGVKVLDTKTFSTASLGDAYGIDVPDEAECVNAFLFEDDGQMWFGTIHHGLVYSAPGYIECLPDYKFGSIKNRGANRNIVSCLCEDGNGRIWVGTDGGGLYEFDAKRHVLKAAKGLEHEKITAIENLSGEELLLTIYNKGIYRYDIRSGKTSYVTIADSETNRRILQDDITIDLKRHSADKIYVSTRSLYEYDIPSGKITGPVIDLSGVSCFVVPYSNPEYTILYNHFEIYRINHETGEAERLLYSNPGNINSVFHTEGKLLVMQSFALHSMDLATGEYKELPFRYNGQLMPVLNADSYGNLWTATQDCMIRFDGISTDSYSVFGTSDGYVPSSFTEGVTLLSDSGNLYFGGSTGLCIADAGNIRSDSPQRHIDLLAVNVDGKNISYGTNGKNRTPSISIPWNYSSMYMDISAHDNAFKSNTFRYTINSRNKQTVIYSDSRLVLSTLSPGQYSIDIACMDRSDNWIDRKNVINVTVVPPWWQSIVFTGSLLILLAGGVLMAVFLYHRQEKIKAARIYRQRKEKLSESKLRFLTNISHELRTPLTLIYAPLKRLLEKNDFSAPVRSELTRILSQSRYMSQLINMVLDSRRLEEGYGKLNISSHDLNAWVKGVADEFRTEYEGKDMSLTCETDPGIGQANFDEGKFRIILSNLIMNAWKYSEPGTAVVIRTALHDGNIRISVIDQGIGISGIDTESLFGRFSQGHTQSKGFGLGLSYTKLLAEAHPGGKIGAYANADKGSTFWFGIPENIPCDAVSALPDKSEIPVPESDSGISRNTEDAGSFDTSSYTVLIAEDEPNLLAFIKRELTGSFKEIYTAMDGREALETTKKKLPDIIVSDIMMPEMNGYELCRNVKNDIEISHIPVILLTAQAESTHRTEGYKSGADIFLTKPFDIPVLLAAIRNTLYGRHVVRERFKDVYSSLSIVESTFSNADEQFMLKLDRFIADNISNDTLDALTIADHMCMGRASFYKKVKDVIGMGIMEYVAEKRMKIAAEILATSKIPVSEVAFKVGYADSRYFSRVFKQYYNVTPTAWREEKA